MQRSITISAAGTMNAEPDIARITTGVVTDADTARDALSRNTAAMKKVIDGLKGAGVAPKDIQTTFFNVEPRQQYAKDKPPVIVGYRVVNQVRITARDLARLGEVLDQTVTLGANNLNGIEFDVAAAETLKDDARKQAMANALRRAKLYAASAGVELGEVIGIAEEVFMPGPRPMPMAKASMSAEAVPIERGSQTLEARVTVTWALK